MTENIILSALAVFPVVALALFIYRRDKYEKEPLRMLIKAFLFGCLSVVPAVMLEQLLTSLWSGLGGDMLPGVFTGVYTGYVVAGFSEELCKMLLLYVAVWKSRDFNEYFDGIVYATFLSLGFAGLENLMYVFSQESYTSALMTGSMRAILSVPGHFLFAVVMGYYFAIAKFQPEARRSNLVKALVYPMLLHGTFDALLMIPEAMGEAYTWLSGVLFPLFIYFDIRMWKIAMQRLRVLQAMSGEQQSYDNYDYTDDHGDYDGGYNSGSGNDPFDGFNWNV